MIESGTIVSLEILANLNRLYTERQERGPAHSKDGENELFFWQNEQHKSIATWIREQGTASLLHLEQAAPLYELAFAYKESQSQRYRLYGDPVTEALTEIMGDSPLLDTHHYDWLMSPQILSYAIAVPSTSEAQSALKSLCDDLEPFVKIQALVREMLCREPLSIVQCWKDEALVKKVYYHTPSQKWGLFGVAQEIKDVSPASRSLYSLVR